MHANWLFQRAAPVIFPVNLGEEVIPPPLLLLLPPPLLLLQSLQVK